MKKLRIHCFQHVAFEGLGSIQEWISSSGHSLTTTRLFENPSFPQLSEIDWLIVMGGTMNTDEEAVYPWLITEKKFIRQAIDAGKTVLGICLGSQLISAALGAGVYRNNQLEIGWFDVDLTSEAQSEGLFYGLGNRLRTFHWHGDTFDLPDDAVLLASSEATKIQAYIYHEKVLALQFHPETTMSSLSEMLDGGTGEAAGEYIQSEDQILNPQLVDENRKLMYMILNRLEEKA